MPAAATPRTIVAGVALPVPEPWGSHLQRLRMSYGEERARDIPTHVTLLPPTPVTAEDLTALRQHLAEVVAAHPPFTVLLRGTGTFRPVSDVVFVQVARGVASCEQLERHIRSGPVARHLDFPYHPHVTLAHDVPVPVLDRAFADLAGFTATFLASDIRLYCHEGDEVWRPVQDYALAG